jgi:beta-glucuronidase
VFTRFHWQQDEALYDWCDRNGMLVQEEIPSWGLPLPPGEAEMTISKAQAGEMIQSHCNHPSIVSWGMANEIKGQAPETSAFMRELKAYFKKIDPTRLVSYVSDSVLLGEPSIDPTNVGDMMMANEYYETWHSGDTGAQLKRVVDGNPGKPLVISETGLPEMIHSGGDKWRCGLIRRKMNIYRSIPELCGVINFSLNDFRTHGGEKGTGVLKRRVHGSTDIFGEPKPSYYVVQEECAPVRIVSVKSSNEKLAVEIRCAADIPSYSVEGYYLEYKGNDDKTIHTEQIPLLKPGNTAVFECANRGISVVCIYRPNGFLALEKEIISPVN